MTTPVSSAITQYLLGLLADKSKTWQETYPHVAGEVRIVLNRLPEGTTWTTNALVEAMIPQERCRGAEQYLARARLYKALAALAKHDLADCATKGEPERHRTFRGGQIIRRTFWHHSRPVAAPVAADDAVWRPQAEKLLNDLKDFLNAVEVPGHTLNSLEKRIRGLLGPGETTLSPPATESTAA